MSNANLVIPFFRETTQVDLKRRLKVSCKTLGTRQASAITTADVETWLAVNGWQGLNCRHYFSAIRALFDIGIRKGAVTINPVAGDGFELPEVPDADPDIMPVKQVARYRNIRDTDGKAITAAMGAAYFELRPEH